MAVINDVWRDEEFKQSKRGTMHKEGFKQKMPL